MSRDWVRTSQLWGANTRSPKRPSLCSRSNPRDYGWSIGRASLVTASILVRPPRVLARHPQLHEKMATLTGIEPTSAIAPVYPPEIPQLPAGWNRLRFRRGAICPSIVSASLREQRSLHLLDAMLGTVRVPATRLLPAIQAPPGITQHGMAPPLVEIQVLRSHRYLDAKPS